MDAPVEYDHLFKILLVGDSGVGKTSCLLAFTTDEFVEREKPTVLLTSHVDNNCGAALVFKYDFFLVCLSVWDLMH
jgi:GTPase SAR1 family protein